MAKNKKADPGTAVTTEDLFIAQTHWKDFWGDQGLEIPNFSGFLGLNGRLTFKESKRGAVFYTTASVARKISKLSSPHWYALLKVYQYRKQRKQ